MRLIGVWLITLCLCVPLLASSRQAKQPQPLQVTAIAPTSGSTKGGTKITVSGAGFEKGAVLSVGYVPATGGYTQATEVQVVSGSKIVAVTPPHPQGEVDVIVTNPSGASVALTGAFEYK